MGAAYQSSHRHISTLARVDITELHPRRAFAITVSEADFNRVGGGREPQASGPMRVLNVWYPGLNVPAATRSR
ncbi:hypothetical protein PISMIDRAFT_15671 [Pisolithus microcarpus 441]|uniref:Uncharacterized protein n=1 Tax=Pisolithus microcarpus 441 TaxID=765257 RepID=A0A0C9YJ05_9AGAM|nr:hypothetical protein PISMIDRAFT_15671 [Pisolithus microcarpus 441]